MHLFKLREGVGAVTVNHIQFIPDEDGFCRVETIDTDTEAKLVAEGHRRATEEDFVVKEDPAEKDEKEALIAKLDAVGVKTDRRRSLATLRMMAAQFVAPEAPRE